MLLEVRQFKKRLKSDLHGLVSELQDATGRYGTAEAEAWRSSLPHLGQALDSAGLERFHVQFGEDAGLDVEYRMPAASAWCDAVLLGRGEQGPAAVMFELKHWDTRHDQPGPRARLVSRHAGLELHPSAQVEGYVEYCRRFHSAVLDECASVDGCVLFTRSDETWAYTGSPHGDLVREFPVFTRRDIRPGGGLAQYLSSRMKRPDIGFASRFVKGQYKQDRNFISQVSRQIRDGTREFVLLDAQRRGFELCCQRIREVLDGAAAAEKVVVIIEGPPGSGKSVLAAHLWAELASWEDLPQGCALVTTSGAQKSNWEHLLSSVAGSKAGAGVIIPANSFNPGITPLWVAEARKKGYSIEVETWPENNRVFLALGHEPRLANDALSVAIVDEAHALIDPAVPGKRGIPPSGWGIHAGPQAWHVMRSSRVSVFLSDPRQSYRDNELTTPQRIRELAKAQNVERVEEVSLGDAQYRCGGSVEYVRWVEGLLSGDGGGAPPSTWRAHGVVPGRFRFEISESPQSLEDALRRERDTGRTVRLMASYARPWVTKDKDPRQLLSMEWDFQLAHEHAGGPRTWSRPWNHAPKGDYARWVQALPGTPMFEDPLCEVGCPYVVRGFDYDCVGLLWLEDLVWRDGAWRVNLQHVHESAWPKTMAAAKKGGPESLAVVLERVVRGYRILLTRAVRGMYVWFADAETRQHVEQALLVGAPQVK